MAGRIKCEYVKIHSRWDLHKYNAARNNDKVYHIAVVESETGKFDALCRYGRRGKGLQVHILVKDVSFNQAHQKASEKADEQMSEGYHISPGITAGVWDDIFVARPQPAAAPQQAPVQVPETSKPTPDLPEKRPNYAPSDWFG